MAGSRRPFGEEEDDDDDVVGVGGLFIIFWMTFDAPMVTLKRKCCPVRPCTAGFHMHFIYNFVFTPGFYFCSVQEGSNGAFKFFLKLE